jgi:hypothetical protein
MRRLMVIVMTCAAALGCAASQYKFSCSGDACEVETAGPATLDFQQEFGETIEVVETRDGRVTMKAGAAQASFAAGDAGRLGPLQVSVENVKGENAYFTVRR